MQIRFVINGCAQRKRDENSKMILSNIFTFEWISVCYCDSIVFFVWLFSDETNGKNHSLSGVNVLFWFSVHLESAGSSSSLSPSVCNLELDFRLQTTHISIHTRNVKCRHQQPSVFPSNYFRSIFQCALGPMLTYAVCS